MKVKLLLCIALILFGALSSLAQNKANETTDLPVPQFGYDVNFSLVGLGQQRLTFLAFSDRRGTFRLVTRRLPSTIGVPAVWTRITPTLMSFSGEMEFPVGNCCRETGTLMFKGQFNSTTGIITGRAVFVTNTPDPTNPTGFVTRTGEFVATPLPIISAN